MWFDVIPLYQFNANITHCIEVIMSAMAFQIISISIGYSTVCSGACQRKYQSPASLAFVRGIHRWPVNFPLKGAVTRKMLPVDDVIMKHININLMWFEMAKYNLIFSLIIWWIVFSPCNPPDVMHGWVSKTWLPILLLYSFSLVDLFELYKCCVFYEVR